MTCINRNVTAMTVKDFYLKFISENASPSFVGHYCPAVNHSPFVWILIDMRHIRQCLCLANGDKSVK